MNEGDAQIIEEAESLGFKTFNWHLLVKEMEFKEVELEECQSEDIYIFSYTSGTTGDSKGVKTSHKGLLVMLETIYHVFPDGPHTFCSYLPLPHVFE